MKISVQRPRRKSRVRKPWEPMRAQSIGDLKAILQMPGGGKLTAPTDDKGDDPRKPKGQEN